MTRHAVQPADRTGLRHRRPYRPVGRQQPAGDAWSAWILQQSAGGQFTERLTLALDLGGVGRYTLITTSPFRHGTPAEQRAWQALVATLEDAPRLHAHRPGTLTKHGPYLHERTGGMIGSLSRLVRVAALDALLDGTEKITKAGLDAIDLDQAAEDHNISRTKRHRNQHAAITASRHTHTCRLCAARHGVIGMAIVHAFPHQRICLRDSRWHGGPIPRPSP